MTIVAVVAVVPAVVVVVAAAVRKERLVTFMFNDLILRCCAWQELAPLFRFLLLRIHSRTFSASGEHVQTDVTALPEPVFGSISVSE